MFRDWVLQPLSKLPLEDTFFLFLAILVLVVVMFSLAFAVTTIFFRLSNTKTAKRWSRLETIWEPSLLMILAGTMDPADLRDAIKPNDQLYFVDFAYRYARRVRGEQRIILANLTEPFLSPLVLRLTTGDSEQRARAVTTLSVLGLRVYAEDVKEMLDDDSPIVAMAAARGLARQEYPQHAIAVLDKMDRFGDWSRNFLASMLASVGTEIAPALRNAFSDPSRSDRARAVAAESLILLNNVEAADTAAVVIQEEEIEKDLAASALRLLAKLGQPRHLDPIRSVCDSPDFVIRAQAIGALMHLDTQEQDLLLIEKAIDDPSPWVAIHAAKGLKLAGKTALLELMIEENHPRAALAHQVLEDR